MKIKDITINDVCEYLRISEADVDTQTLLNVMSAAESFISAYTGLTKTEVNEHDDFFIAYMVLCQDMYDNRSMYTDKPDINRVVSSVLGMHRTNLV